MLLKANAQRNGKGGADDGYGANAVVVLHLLAQLSVDRMFHLALHAVVTGTREGAADLHAVNGGNYQTSGPIRGEYSIAFQLTGDLTAQSENSTGILPFEGIPDGVFTERANAFRESASLAFRFDPVHGRKLTSGTQKHGIKDLFPGMLWKPASFRQRLHSCGEIKHLVQIGFESMPARGYDFSFSFKNRRRLMRQIVAAAASKRCRNWIFSRTWSTKASGMWKVLGLPSTRTEICDWVWMC